MERAHLSRIVDDIARRCMSAETLGYFDCLEALDALEFHILDRIDPADGSREMAVVREDARRLHTRLTSEAQAAIDALIHTICSQQITPPALKQLFNQYAESVRDHSIKDQPDYDLFDDFLSHLLQVDYEPSETRARTAEMVYLQPTPGRIILELINELPLTKADRFYDLGSGLGRVPILVSLLTEAAAVGIEVEPTYVEYSGRSARKLGSSNHIEFRNMDVRDAELSDGTIFYLYSPFTGSILRKVLNQLRDLSQERSITLCTYGPCTPIIAQEPWLAPVRYSEGQLYRLAILRSTGAVC